MKLQARETNYGARIDYVLVTRGLLPWIKHGDIQPSLRGSDHCPVYVDLHDELTLDSGETIRLSDAMKQKEGMQPPRIAAKYWEELAGKQTMLSSFFGKRGAQPSPPVEASQSNRMQHITNIVFTSEVRDQVAVTSRIAAFSANVTARQSISSIYRIHQQPIRHNT